jgi:hypothetical protein
MKPRATDRRTRRAFRPALFDRLERRQVLSGNPASLTLIPVATRLHATEGRPNSELTVAFFSTTREGAKPDDFVALLDLGDGWRGGGTIYATTFPPTTDPDTGAPIPGWTVFEVRTSYRFHKDGALPIAVTLTDVIDGQSASGVTATVEVAGGALAASGPLEVLRTLERQPQSFANLAVIEQVGWHAPGEYAATIAWGDGQVGDGTVVVAGTPGDGDSIPLTYLSVGGRHAYGADGIYTYQVTIRSDDGQTATASGTVAVANVPAPFSARLDPASDRGASNADGITNDNRPLYAGAAEPGSTVEIVALRIDGGGTPRIVGRQVVPAGGLWSFRTSALADGRYRLAATAYNASGQPQQSADLGALVIDTAAPVVTAARLDGRTGRAELSFRDDRSGLNVATLGDRSVYTLTRPALRPNVPGQVFSPTALTVGNATTAGARTVALTFQAGRRLPAASYLLATRPAGIADLAGNVLDGEFRGAFPSGSGRPGNSFVALFQVGSTGATSAPRPAVLPPVVTPTPTPTPTPRPRRLTR